MTPTFYPYYFHGWITPITLVSYSSMKIPESCQGPYVIQERFTNGTDTVLTGETSVRDISKERRYTRVPSDLGPYRRGTRRTMDW